MKTYITIVTILVCGLIGVYAGDYLPNYTYNAWDNYYQQYGEYFDKYFHEPRQLYYAPNRAAHEATLREMARLGIPYYNHYTGEYNHVETPNYIFNSSKTVEEYRARMEAWKHSNLYH